MNTPPKTVRVLMWNVTSEGADFWFSAFSWLLVAAAILVGVATYGVTVMGTAKERFADSRIAANEADTARAIAEAETAKEGAANANARAAEAELALEKYRKGRSLDDDQSTKLLEALKAAPKGRVIIKPNFVDSEATLFANQLSRIFNEAGFEKVGDAPLDIVALHRPGVFMAFRDMKAMPPHFVPILQALRSAGVPIADFGAVNWVPDNDTVVIVVAGKP